MTPEEFKNKAQQIFDEYKGDAGEAGHMAIDDLMDECLRGLGYSEGLNILWKMTSIWYA